jgi:anaphase-promoting complex subunit 2
VPLAVGSRQRAYEQGYEHLKSTRKLTWLDHLGQATVELEMRDRTLSVDCKTYEATVIYAFQDPDRAAEDEGGEAGGHGRPAPREDAASPTRPVRRTAEDLREQLSMDEELLVAALGFWTAKGVLRRDRRDGYVVAETLGDAGGADGRTTTAAADDDDDNERDDVEDNKQASGSAAAPTNTPAGPGTTSSSGGGGGGKSSDPRRAVYWQYVVGMLTNASAQMPPAQIAMMLKMLVPDGFPWSSEELREFLGEKVAAGELEVAGGKYRLPRK